MPLLWRAGRTGGRNGGHPAEQRRLHDVRAGRAGAFLRAAWTRWCRHGCAGVPRIGCSARHSTALRVSNMRRLPPNAQNCGPVPTLPLLPAILPSTLPAPTIHHYSMLFIFFPILHYLPNTTFFFVWTTRALPLRPFTVGLKTSVFRFAVVTLFLRWRVLLGF
jgi:hypothetical protein